MKAAVVKRAGSSWAISIEEVPKPAPVAGEVRVRVHSATVNRTDYGELRHPLLQRLIIARGRAQRTILGMDFAGEVDAVGEGVHGFKSGDRVFGLCSLLGNGAQAEYFCMSATGPIGLLPATIPFGQAVVCEGAYYANGGLAALGVGPGHRILVYGASGAIGTAAVQLAKYYGADVTAVVAGRHLAMARTLGADHVIDYATEEFARLGKSFDFVHDAVGKMTVFQWQRLLKPNGKFITTDIGPWGQSLLFVLWSKLTGSGRVSVPLPKRGSAHEFVNFLGERLAAGQFRAIIDRTYPLDDIADAYRYVQTGQKAGIVGLDVVLA